MQWLRIGNLTLLNDILSQHHGMIVSEIDYPEEFTNETIVNHDSSLLLSRVKRVRQVTEMKSLVVEAARRWHLRIVLLSSSPSFYLKQSLHAHKPSTVRRGRELSTKTNQKKKKCSVFID